VARQLCPVDTGFLRRSIHVEPDSPALRISVIASAPYAAYVEYGTPHSPAQPFMTPAARAIDVKAEVARYVRAAIARSVLR
jgi:HK97 gp10 family phage protein